MNVVPKETSPDASIKKKQTNKHLDSANTKASKIVSVYGSRYISNYEFIRSTFIALKLDL